VPSPGKLVLEIETDQRRVRARGLQGLNHSPFRIAGRPTIMAEGEEIFDVVNERDEVVASKPRSEVHRLGLLHRAAHVLVFNSRGQVFLQKRSMKKDRQPGVWDSSASGHVDSGEDYDTCAVRELDEEIGLRHRALQKLFKVAAQPGTDREFVWVYRCEAEGPFELNAEEIDEGGWFDPAEVTRWAAERPDDFATAFLVIWAEISRQAIA